MLGHDAMFVCRSARRPDALRGAESISRCGCVAVFLHRHLSHAAARSREFRLEKYRERLLVAIRQSFASCQAISPVVNI
jgi:hypothetical protein